MSQRGMELLAFVLAVPFLLAILYLIAFLRYSDQKEQISSYSKTPG